MNSHFRRWTILTKCRLKLYKIGMQDCKISRILITEIKSVKIEKRHSLQADCFTYSLKILLQLSFSPSLRLCPRVIYCWREIFLCSLYQWNISDWGGDKSYTFVPLKLNFKSSSRGCRGTRLCNSHTCIGLYSLWRRSFADAMAFCPV